MRFFASSPKENYLGLDVINEIINNISVLNLPELPFENSEDCKNIIINTIIFNFNYIHRYATYADLISSSTNANLFVLGNSHTLSGSAVLRNMQKKII